jgi:hypothetical protein
MERPCKNQRHGEEKQEFTAYRRVSQSVEGTGKIFGRYARRGPDLAIAQKVRVGFEDLRKPSGEFVIAMPIRYGAAAIQEADLRQSRGNEPRRSRPDGCMQH